jgi:hypothetical protein
MSIFDSKTKLVVKDESLTVQDLIGRAPLEITSLIEVANVVILPSHGTEDKFYNSTLDTLDYLNENKVLTEVFATDDDYKVLGLHGADIWLGTFIIKNFIIPVFCGVIATYIYEKLKAQKGDKVSLKFIVEKKDGNTTSVSFDGKVEDLSKALDEVKKFSDEK